MAKPFFCLVPRERREMKVLKKKKKKKNLEVALVLEGIGSDTAVENVAMALLGASKDDVVAAVVDEGDLVRRRGKRQGDFAAIELRKGESEDDI